MRKLTAVLCVVALVMLMAVPAFANPSITWPGEVLEPEGIIVTEIDDETEIPDAKVKEAIEGVNGEGYLTPDDVVVLLKGPEAPEREDVKGYSFSSWFKMIDVNPESGLAFPVDVKFAGTDENTRIMLVDPADPESLVIIKANEDGSFTIPFKGAFAMIDPTP